MKRADLEHLIRAAADIADDDEIIVLGSQAILGPFPDAPPELLVSAEADVYPKNHPERWELIDGSIGELSPFHETFGYYAQGVEPGVAILPDGWETRLVIVSNERRLIFPMRSRRRSLDSPTHFRRDRRAHGHG